MADYNLNYSIVLSIERSDFYPSDTLFPSDRLFPCGKEKLKNIVESSMRLNRVLCDNGLRYGEACADMFEVNLFDTNINAENLKIFSYVIYDDAPEFEFPLFVGKVDSCCRVDYYSDEIHLVAYDELYEAGKEDATDWINNMLNNGIVYVGDMLSQLLTKMGLSLDRTIAQYANEHTIVGVVNNFKIYPPIKIVDEYDENDGLKRTKTPLEVKKITYRALLSMICELMCCVPHINPDGKLQLFFFDEITSDNAYQLTTDDIEIPSASTESYDTAKIDGVKFVGMMDTGERMYRVGNSEPTNPYIVENNLVLSSLSNLEFSTDISRQNQLTSLAQNMIYKMKDIAFRPMNILTIINSLIRDANLSLLGRKIIWEDVKSYALKEELSGAMLLNQTLSAQSDFLQNSTSVYEVEYREKTV